jgi:SAM-dependent methyltransferase
MHDPTTMSNQTEIANGEIEDRVLPRDKTVMTSFGAVARYFGDQGEKYFQWQRTVGRLSAEFNGFIFKPYLNEQDDVLEFGCGGGYLLNRLNARTKVGVDINPAARAEAKSLGLEVYNSLDDIGNQRFSRIVTSHALEHVAEPYEALVRLRRFLKSDGLLLWLSPMDDWRKKNQRRWKPDDIDMHLYAWTPLLMGNLLDAAGYKPQSVSIVTHAFPPLAISERLWNISPRLFHAAAHVWAIAARQRQILAVASPALPYRA